MDIFAGSLQGDECWPISVNGPGGTTMLVTVAMVRGRNTFNLRRRG
jgi:hypothetical protein